MLNSLLINKAQGILKENLIDIIFKYNGGSLSDELISRIKPNYDYHLDEHLQPFIDYMRENVCTEGFDEFETALILNYTEYAEKGYGMGFNDGICFLISALSNK